MRRAQTPDKHLNFECKWKTYISLTLISAIFTGWTKHPVELNWTQKWLLPLLNCIVLSIVIIRSTMDWQWINCHKISWISSIELKVNIKPNHHKNLENNFWLASEVKEKSNIFCRGKKEEYRHSIRVFQSTSMATCMSLLWIQKTLNSFRRTNSSKIFRIVCVQWIREKKTVRRGVSLLRGWLKVFNFSNIHSCKFSTLPPMFCEFYYVWL